MSNKKNNSNLSFILFFLFLLLIAIPFILQPFNDRYLNLINQKYSNLETIDTVLKEEFQEQVKIPYYLTLKTDKKTYIPYEPITISFLIVDKQTQKLITNIVPKVTVFNSNNVIMKNIVQSISQSLAFSTQDNVFQTTVLLDDTDYMGELSIEMTLDQKNYNQEISRKVYVDIQKPQALFKLPKKYVFLGLESKEAIASRSILSTEGKETGTVGLVPWFKILNNDAIVMPSSISKTFSYGNNDVWDKQKFQESKTLSKQFSQQGFDVALWIQALKLDGLDIEKYQYQYSVPQEGNTNETVIVSIQENKRKMELISVLKDHMDDSSIEYVGLKDVFFQNYHTELYNSFLTQYPMSISQELRNKAFEKWKQYAIVEYYKNIFSSLKQSKALFMIFSAEEISLYPDFIQMAFATGVDFIFVDLDAPIKDLDMQLQLVSKSLLEKYPSQVILSYCLNYNNLVSGQSSPINNWIEQNLRLFQQQNSDAIYIKDFYRAMFGNRGSYPAYEWLLSIGELISSWKQSKRIYPIEQFYTVDTVFVNSNVTLNISLKNISTDIISNISIDLLPVTENDRLNLVKYEILNPGEIIRTNMSFTNLQFKQSILQKRIRFIALESSFSVATNTNKQVDLISFIDPKIEKDIIFSESELNLKNKAIQEEKLRQEEATRKLKQEEKKRLKNLEAKSNQNTLEIKEEEKEEAEEKKEVKKESWLERRARERREREEREE